MVSEGKRDKIQVQALEGIGKAMGWNVQAGQEAATGGIHINIRVGNKPPIIMGDQSLVTLPEPAPEVIDVQPEPGLTDDDFEPIPD